MSREGASTRRSSWPARFGVAGIVLGALAAAEYTPDQTVAGWIAGDHHIHSRFSVGWDRETQPPAPRIGGDGIYAIPMNALMARHFGLRWMVATDHGGPNHSKINFEQGYPELVLSREAVPEVIQFYGMEFDSPGADHSSVIIPHTHDEAEKLRTIESRFSALEPWPWDPEWATEPRMIEALSFMNTLTEPPVVIAHHPARSATGVGAYGLDTPAELRAWNDTAPGVAIGMEGAPGHQAAAVARDGSARARGRRGGYSSSPTLGGFDQLTARLGGFWDSMLGEGRHWWITANSDSHVNWREGGSDFWPGEYSKTYVYAEPTHESVLAGLRAGHVFVTLGDLVSEVDITVVGGGNSATIGGTLEVPAGTELEITIRLRDPAGVNHHGDRPQVTRVDLIRGDQTGRLADSATDVNPTTTVARRFFEADWQRTGEVLEMTARLGPVTRSGYLRVRGTNALELEPAPDPAGEDPWTDLWFYTNPVFVDVW